MEGAALQLHARFGDLDDRIFGDVDQRDVGLVEDLVITGIDDDAARADIGALLGDQPLGRHRILDRLANLVADEVGHFLRGFGIGRHVGIDADQRRRSRGPALFHIGEALFGRVFGGRHSEGRTDIHEGRGEAVALPFAVRGIDVLARLDDVIGQRWSEAWQAVLCGPLQHEEVIGLLGDRGRCLDAGRSGAENGDALALELDLFARPTAGVVEFALEALDARNVGQVRFGQGPRSADEEAGLIAIALVGADRPGLRFLVPVRLVDRGVELDVAAQIVAIGEVERIGQDFGLGGVTLGPVPFLIEFVVPRHRIVHRRHVAARARITVPVPGSADIAAALDHQRRQPQLAQLDQHVHAAKARADHDRIETLHFLNILQHPLHAFRIGPFGRQRVAAVASRTSFRKLALASVT